MPPTLSANLFLITDVFPHLPCLIMFMLFSFLNFYYFSNCVCVCLCAQEFKVASKNGVLQEFELLAVVSQAVWVLGTELGASGKAGSTVLSTTEPSLYPSYSRYCSCQTAYFLHPPAKIL